MKKPVSALLAAFVTFALLAPCVLTFAAEKTPEKTYAAKYEKNGLVPKGFAFKTGHTFKNDSGFPCFIGKWYDKSGTELYIAEADGFVVDYNIGSSEYEDGYVNNVNFDCTAKGKYLSGLKKKELSESELKETAEKFFRKANPKLIGAFNAEGSDCGDNFISYMFTRVINGVELFNYTGSVMIEKTTGAVVNMNLLPNFVNLPDSDFPKTENIITPYEAAYSYFYKEDLGSLTLCYVYNEEDGTASPEYIPENCRYAWLLAENGREAENDYYYYYRYAAPLPAPEGSDGEDDGTYDWDIDHYDDYDHCEDDVIHLKYKYLKPRDDGSEASGKRKKGYVTSGTLLRKVKADKNIALPDKLKLKLIKETFGTFEYEPGKKREVIYCTFSDGNTDPELEQPEYMLFVCADAKTGEILSFSRSYGVYYTGSDEKKEELAKKHLKHFLGDKAKEYRFDGEESRYLNESILIFTLYKNNIPFYYDRVYIILDGSGNAAHFSISSDIPQKGIGFKTGKTISKKKALKIYNEKFPPELCYFVHPDGKAELIYYFGNNGNGFEINALTGEIIERVSDGETEEI